jgi:hypothetical protein
MVAFTETDTDAEWLALFDADSDVIVVTVKIGVCDGLE